MTDNTEAHRHACEVRYWVARCYPNGLEMADQMMRIEKKRGKAAADVLRADARIEWARRIGNRNDKAKWLA